MLLIISSASTLALLPVLNLLVQPGRSHEWLRSELVSALARLPLRHRGVQYTIEFILSIHPSTANSSSSKSGLVRPSAGGGATLRVAARGVLWPGSAARCFDAPARREQAGATG